MNIKNIKVGQKLRLKWLTDEDVQDIDNSVGWVDGLDDYYGKVFEVLNIEEDGDMLQSKIPNTSDRFWLQPCYFDDITDEDELSDYKITVTLHRCDWEFLSNLIENHSDILEEDESGLIRHLHECYRLAEERHIIKRYAK